MSENGSGLSSSDVLALTNNDRYNDGMFGGNSFFWVFALLLLNNGGFGGWGGRGMGPGPGVTNADLNASQNAQTNQLMLDNLQQQLSDNRYDLAQVVHQQTDTLINQNNSNLINAIQGFNNLGLQITNQTNTLSSQLQQLGAQMNMCCCDVKTQMLSDRLDNERAKNVELQGQISNLNQSQYILGQLGRFVAWAGSGSQSFATTSTT